jgi:L-2,4-diaminobutyric acid acetyltransferase
VANQASSGGENQRSEPLRFRPPSVDDGPALWRLVIDVGTLDRNSSYTYLLLCRDFSETCIVAERAGELLGCVTGYRPPAQPDTLFVWQVGVAERARGQGLAGRLLDRLLLSDGCRDVRFLETTVTPSNAASHALFRSLAGRLAAELAESAGFPADLFPEGGHEREDRLRIGAFDTSTLRT